MSTKPIVTITMNNGGVMKAELYPEIAPNTVNNFIALANGGFYNGIIFHRVIEGFMIQGGGFIQDGNGLSHKNAPRTIRGEFASNGVKNDLKHTAGVISMARTMVPDSASSQFFICVEDVPYLDGQYAAFGQTSDPESLAVAIGISKVRTGRIDGYDDVPLSPVVITKASVIK